VTETAVRPTAAGRLVPPAVVGGLAAAAVAVVGLADPDRTRLSVCPVLALTGVACPLCGGLRAVHALTGGDLASALAFNSLVVVVLPLLVLGWLAWVRRATEGRPGGVVPPWVIWAGAGVFMAFGVLRNLPSLVPYLTAWLG
jgi:hypothetical protein